MQGQEVALKGSKCEDCGNQAKKDCLHQRCRTCCKNKGFECQTHIKSTWIPVDRRRYKSVDDDQTQDLQHLQGDIIPKRHKHNPCSGLGELEFPASMSSVATFSSVRVRSMDDAVNEIAYQTSVNIGGHVFGGLLYDQGPDHHSFNTINAARPRGESSTDPLDYHDHQHQHQHQHQHHHNLNLMSDAIAIHAHDGANVAAISATTSSAHEHPFPTTPPHPFPLPYYNSFRPGMPYFSHPRP